MLDYLFFFDGFDGFYSIFYLFWNLISFPDGNVRRRQLASNRCAEVLCMEVMDADKILNIE